MNEYVCSFITSQQFHFHFCSRSLHLESSRHPDITINGQTWSPLELFEPFSPSSGSSQPSSSSASAPITPIG
jgi:hypothetical protein